MNPLPNRPLLNTPAAPLSLPNVPQFDQIAYNGRPRKVLPEGGKEFPILNGMGTITGPPPVSTPNGGPQISILERNPHSNASLAPQPSPLSQITAQTTGSSQDSTISAQADTNASDADSESRSITAIFRPDDAGEWKAKLRLSHETSEKAKTASVSSEAWDGHSEEEGEVKEDEGDVEEDEGTLIGEGENTKSWKAKRTLRKYVCHSSLSTTYADFYGLSHLDAVRALAFHPTELCLATGGDDCTVKIWRMDVASLASST